MSNFRAEMRGSKNASKSSIASIVIAKSVQAGIRELVNHALRNIFIL